MRQLESIRLAVLMKAVVFDKTIITPGGQFIAYRTVYDIWAQGQWLSGYSVGSVELRHQQNTPNSIRLTFLRRTSGSEVLLIFPLIISKQNYPLK
jgi:hypothetical protein